MATPEVDWMVWDGVTYTPDATLDARHCEWCGDPDRAPIARVGSGVDSTEACARCLTTVISIALDENGYADVEVTTS